VPRWPSSRTASRPQGCRNLQHHSRPVPAIIVLWLAVWYVKREQTGLKVNLGEVIVGKFPVFVLGFILMFALSSTGVFAPAQHYVGKFFDNSEAKLVKTDKEGKVTSKMLKDEEVATLQAESAKVQREDQKAALARLIENRKEMSIDDDTLPAWPGQRQGPVEGR